MKENKLLVYALIGLETKMPQGAFYAFSDITQVTKKKSADFAKELLQNVK